MNEINAWGAYESGTTQTARPLGNGGVLRQRRQSAVAPTHQLKPSISLGDLQKDRVNEQPSLSGYKVKSTHALFFGTDDATSLKEKTDDETVPDESATKEPTFVDANHAKEWREMRDLARSVFHVYFADHDSDDVEIAKMKQSYASKKPSLLNKINGTMPWLPGLINESKAPNIVKVLILFIEASFRGIAQVFFQNNPLSGLLILAAMFIQSSRVAVHGIIAIVCGNLSGLFMGFDKSFLSCGLFGYNSFLVGLAIATFDSSEMHEGYNWQAMIGVIVTSYFSSVLFVMLGKILSPYKTPPFTLPFNISALAFLLALKQITRNETGEEEPFVPGATAPLTATAFFAGSIRGVGQVFLANNIISGVLVLISIMLCSRISAVAAFVGSLVGTAVAALVGEDTASIENGLYGFNSSLTLTAMVMFYVPSFGSVSFGLVASVVTVFVQLALTETLQLYDLPSMTLPFCLAALVFIVIQGTTSSVISVPLSSMTTPEDHLMRVKRLSAGFDLLFGAIRSSSHEGGIGKSWKSVVGYKGGTERLSMVLEEYHEEVHGVEETNGLFGCCKQLCRRSTRESLFRNIRQSFHMSSAMNNNAASDAKSYGRMFTYIDKNNEHKISKSQFEACLRSFGLDDEVGLDFALEAFQLMDLDRSGDIDSFEFTAFAKISRHMPAVRSLIVKFFDFVDVNGDQAVEITELDSACQYLNLPPISADDRDSLNSLCNREGELDFDVIVNFVTIFKLKSIIKEYQESGDKGEDNLDQSLRSAVL